MVQSIIQLTDQVFLFPYIEHPAMYAFGAKPEWDNSGAVSHVLPTYEMYNKEEYSWIIENKMPYEIIKIDPGRKMRHVRLTNIEDAMAFKLRWL